MENESQMEQDRRERKGDVTGNSPVRDAIDGMAFMISVIRSGEQLDDEEFFEIRRKMLRLDQYRVTRNRLLAALKAMVGATEVMPENMDQVEHDARLAIYEAERPL